MDSCSFPAAGDVGRTNVPSHNQISLGVVDSWSVLMILPFASKSNAPEAAEGPSAVLSIRHNPANPDHHLFNNHGTWWLHCTLHLPDCTKHRLRKSLRTSDRGLARVRRDEVLAGLRCA